MCGKGGEGVKALYIPLVVLAVLAGSSLWIGQRTQTLTAEQLPLLEEAEASVREENWSRAASTLENAQQKWQSHRLFLHTTNRHDDLGQIEALYSGAKAACLCGDRDECLVLLAQLRLQLALLADNQTFSAENIL